MRALLLKGKTAALLLVFVLTLLLPGCAKEDVKAVYIRGCEALEAGDMDQAAEYFSTVIETGMFLPEAYRGLGLTYLSAGNLPDAAVAFEKSLYHVESQDDAFQRDVNLYLAYCRERQGQTEKAKNIYNEIIMKSPDAETLFLRGRLSLRAEDEHAAALDFDQAVTLEPGYDLFINLYELYADVDKSGDGSRYLEEALTEVSRNTEDYYSRGLVNYYLQNYDEAREMLIESMRRSPDDGKSVFLLGKIYLETGDLANARAVYTGSVDNEKTAAAAHNVLALCDIEEEDYESALQHIEAGLAAEDPASVQGLLYNEIVVYEHLHDWTQATRKAAEYVTKYPADEAGLREYEFLSSK